MCKNLYITVNKHLIEETKFYGSINEKIYHLSFHYLFSIYLSSTCLSIYHLLFSEKIEEKVKDFTIFDVGLETPKERQYEKE